MAEAANDAPRPICRAVDLVERGKAALFEVRHYRETLRAFALRFDGRVVAYLNRCVHVPVEMDWQPGEFLDADRELIVCSMHGAAYLPQTGRCVGGPCGRGSLIALRVAEIDGMVCWYPSRDMRPVAASALAATAPESPR